MLRIENMDCRYGEALALRGVSLELKAGEVLCLMGRNGAGKTTLLRAIMGLMPLSAGRILLQETELSRLPAHEIPRQGIAYVPQGRRLFADMSVAENLKIGLMARDRGLSRLESVLGLFPALRERMSQRAGTLSGGEQQMLAIARALCLEPKVLLLDEPTEGLMPSMIARIVETVSGLKSTGLATILVEQRLDAVLALADRIAFMETGRMKEVVAPADVRRDPSLLHHYVGVGLRSL
jgi:branched-chain amino acid transport system ATP-binding protein